MRPNTVSFWAVWLIIALVWTSAAGSDINSVGETIEKADKAVAERKTEIDETIAKINNTINAAVNAVASSVIAINNTVEGTTTTIDNTKRAAQNLVHGSKESTADILGNGVCSVRVPRLVWLFITCLSAVFLASPWL